MTENTVGRRTAAEALGTGLLVATVVGSGIMAEKPAGGNVAIALLGNTIPTGAILVVLILALGPISGAHFNPAVSLGANAHGYLRGDRTGQRTDVHDRAGGWCDHGHGPHAMAARIGQ